MWFINVLRCKGNTRRTISVFMCVLFIIFCVFVMLLGFLVPRVWGVIYSMDSINPELDGMVILYTFTASVLVICGFTMISLKQDSKLEILIALLLLLLFWQIHLVITFAAMVCHLVHMPEKKKASSAFYRTLPLIAIQGLWLYFISNIWYYWRQLSSMRDFPAYCRFLRMRSLRKKALRQDQRERLGEIPKKLLNQLTPHPSGMYLADGL